MLQLCVCLFNSEPAQSLNVEAGCNKEVYSCRLTVGVYLTRLVGAGRRLLARAPRFSRVYSKPEKPDYPENRRSYTSGFTPSPLPPPGQQPFRSDALLCKTNGSRVQPQSAVGFSTAGSP